MSFLLTTVLLPALIGGGQGLTQAEKNALLSRKLWYVSFEFTMSGRTGATGGGDTWSVSRNTTGTLLLNNAIPGQWPMSLRAEPNFPLLTGRFISWMTVPTEAAYAAIERGEQNPARLPNHYFPINRSVNESIQSGDASTGRYDSWQGASASFALGTCMLMMDLETGLYDVVFQVGPTDLGTQIRHEWRTPGKSGVDEAAPTQHMAWLGGEYGPQLMKRRLRADMKADGTISFTLSGPTTLSSPLHGKIVTMTAQFTFSPSPPSNAKLIIEPSDPTQYREWRPTPGPNENEPGSDLAFTWMVVEPGNPNAKIEVDKVTFRLGNVSRYSGVCMNWPPPNPGATAPKPDLQFAPPEPGELDYTVQSDNLVAIVDGDEANIGVGEVVVQCLDGGAIGELIAEAQLKDGRILQCEVQGQPGRRKILIPDRDEGVSDVAKAWRAIRANGLTDDDDNEGDPEGDTRAPGDGLSVWEEYRGFFQGGAWRDNCFPTKKDIFLDNRAGAAATSGIDCFADATGLIVHEKTLFKEFRSDWTINYVGVKGSHVDQHGLLIKPGSGAAGVCKRMPSARFPGPPKNTLVVRFILCEDVDRAFQITPTITYTRNDRAGHLAHELCHGIGIYHHGDADPWDLPNGGFGVEWFRAQTSSTPPQDRVKEGIGGSLYQVFGEASMVQMPNDVIFGPGASYLTMKLGKRSGQHSGDADCVMRYNVAQAYERLGVPSDRIVHNGGEMPGGKLCRNGAGTLINHPSHSPQSRYGNALQNRGDCAHQFVINDRYDKQYR